jgi:hypothetical protein
MVSQPDPTASALVFIRGLSEGQFLPYFQSQLPNHPQGCGPFSIAMAANLGNRFYDKETNVSGEEVEQELEHKALKIHGFGMPTWWGYSRSLGLFIPGKAEYKNHACIQDLEQAISENQLSIVAIAWQTTIQILRDIRHASVGHYMVAVGYNPVDGIIYFLNPALYTKEGREHLSAWTYQEFDKYWNGTWNLFIRPGCMWKITV